LSPAPYEIHGCYGGHCGGPALYGPILSAPPEPAMFVPEESRVTPGYRMATR
jgi:hypothetical protein